MCLHLSSKNFLIPIVITDGCDSGGVCVQGNRRERLTLRIETPNQLCCQVLGLSGGAPVSSSQKAVTFTNPMSQSYSPPVKPLRFACKVIKNRPHLREVVVNDVGRFHPPTPAWAPNVRVARMRRYVFSVRAAMPSQEYRLSTRLRPLRPYRFKWRGLPSIWSSTSARRRESWGGTSLPVTPSTTVSVSPPTADATTGTPHAIASSGTIPKGSYHGVHATTSAERMKEGNSSRETCPVRWTLSLRPRT